MKNSERLFYFPLGDSADPDLETVTYRQAKLFADQILDEEDAQGNLAMAAIVSLQKLPGVFPFFYLRYPVHSTGGYLVEVRVVKERNQQITD